MRNNYEQFILVVSVVFKFLLLFDNSIKQRLSLWRRGESTSKSRSKFGTESHGKREARTYNGDLGESPAGSWTEPLVWLVRRSGGEAPEAERFLHLHNLRSRPICTKVCLFVQNKKLCRTFGAPWIRQWENHIRSITTQRLSEIFDCFAKLGSMMAPYFLTQRYCPWGRITESVG